MLFGSIVLVLTALWHALASWHFAVTPARARSAAPPASVRSPPIAIELFRFLGAMNAGFIVLAMLALLAFPEGRPLAFIVLAAANLSQAVVDLRVQRLGLAHGPMFKQIFVGDVVFTAANLVALSLG